MPLAGDAEVAEVPSDGLSPGLLKSPMNGLAVVWFAESAGDAEVAEVLLAEPSPGLPESSVVAVVWFAKMLK